MSRPLCLFTLAALAFAAAGCPPPQAPAPKGYFGPTISPQAVVNSVNANNQRIATIWASGDFEAEIHPDPANRQTSDFLNGELVLLYRAPDQILLVGKKDVAGRIFEIGSNGVAYWMTARGQTDTCWWGKYATIDKLDPKAMPVRPDLLLDVLGVTPIDSDMLRQPVPVMRFNNDADAYMMVWSLRGPSYWLAQQETWYDRQTLLPRLVNLFDTGGRVVLSAYLSDHMPIASSPESADSGAAPPLVATSFRLFFPDTGTRLRFHLTKLKTTNNGIPNEHSFRFDPDLTGVGHVVRVDQGN
jgi:hypothetical protein